MDSYFACATQAASSSASLYEIFWYWIRLILFYFLATTAVATIVILPRISSSGIVLSFIHLITNERMELKFSWTSRVHVVSAENNREKRTKFKLFIEKENAIHAGRMHTFAVAHSVWAKQQHLLWQWAFEHMHVICGKSQYFVLSRVTNNNSGGVEDARRHRLQRPLNRPIGEKQSKNVWNWIIFGGTGVEGSGSARVVCIIRFTVHHRQSLLPWKLIYGEKTTCSEKKNEKYETEIQIQCLTLLIMAAPMTNEWIETKRNDGKAKEANGKFQINWMRHSLPSKYTSFKWSVYIRARAHTHTPFKVKLRLIQSLSHDITFRGISARAVLCLSFARCFFRFHSTSALPSAKAKRINFWKLWADRTVFNAIYGDSSGNSSTVAMVARDREFDPFRIHFVLRFDSRCIYSVEPRARRRNHKKNFIMSASGDKFNFSKK